MIEPHLNVDAFPKPKLEELPGDDEAMSESNRKVATDRINKPNQRKQKDYEERIGQAGGVVDALRERLLDI